jgi:predicted TIM-barrel fold metal-dependent hydrolase
MITAREAHAAGDATFAEMYGDPAAKMATAEDLLLSMDGAGIEVSVALGFAWASMDACRRHNDYLLQQARESDGRLVAFCCLSGEALASEAAAEIRRVAAAGAGGLGELRSVGCVTSPEALTALRETGLIVLFHVSEPVGHIYPGKQGVTVDEMAAAAGALGVPSIAAHWGGGLPFFTLMPEVRDALKQTYFDTAATRYLYQPDIYRRAAELAGAERILFGSDFPLISQKAARDEVEAAGLSDGELAQVLGGNAALLLGPS